MKCSIIHNINYKILILRNYTVLFVSYKPIIDCIALIQLFKKMKYHYLELIICLQLIFVLFYYLQINSFTFLY